MQTVTLLEGAKLELQGAERRLALALQEIADFDSEFSGKNVSPELARDLAHQRECLECELDAARRRHAECLAQVNDLRR